MAKAQVITLPLWMKRQAELFAEEKLRQLGVEKGSRDYQKKFDRAVQSFAREAFETSLTAPERDE